MLIAGLLSAIGGCQLGESYVVVALVSARGQIPNAAQFVVDIRSGNSTDRLFYPLVPGGPYALSIDTPVTFSVSFSSDHGGLVDVSVTALDGAGQPLGAGASQATIDSGYVTNVTVAIIPGLTAPPVLDAGVMDAPINDGGPDGADDGSSVTTCTAGRSVGSGCGSNQTCGILCRQDDSSIGLCEAAGTKAPGEICATATDCAPGSQCLMDVCGVRTCRNLCREAADCSAGASCLTEVTCGASMTPTGVRICSQPCDPRGTAMNGCAAGLRCFLFGNEVTDCDCVEPTRVGGDGVACENSNGCQPGFICVTMASTKVCRRVCRLDAPDCAAGLTCDRLTDPTFSTYGACLPQN
jgi:hypothetical protein